MHNNDVSIAVLCTCFNRKEKTIRCIESLMKQEDMPLFDFYVCDDGSTDGTSDAIREICPGATILQGTGNLFWSKGMHRVMEVATRKDYDYYLMINDDVEFIPSMWKSVFEPYRMDKNGCGVVGYTKSRITGELTYGGRKMVKTRTNYVNSGIIGICRDDFAKVDVANWNCFLIDKYVIQNVGLIDSYFEHGLGDYDYCLRMRKKGLEIYVAKKYVGYCENNSKKNTYMDGTVARNKRVKMMLRPNGFPIKSWFYFVNKHYGMCKYRSAIMPYVKNVIAIIFGKDI